MQAHISQGQRIKNHPKFDRSHSSFLAHGIWHCLVQGSQHFSPQGCPQSSGRLQRDSHCIASSAWLELHALCILRCDCGKAGQSNNFSTLQSETLPHSSEHFWGHKCPQASFFGHGISHCFVHGSQHFSPQGCPQSSCRLQRDSHCIASSAWLELHALCILRCKRGKAGQSNNFSTLQSETLPHSSKHLLGHKCPHSSSFLQRFSHRVVHSSLHSSLQ